MERRRLGLQEDPLLVLSEGNSSATMVLMNFLEKEEDLIGFVNMLNLDDMNIRGAQIWLAFKDYCGQDIDLLMKLVSERDADLVENVNIANAKQGNPFKAVEHGASYWESPKEFKFTKEEQADYASREFKSYKMQHPEFEAGGQ